MQALVLCTWVVDGLDREGGDIFLAVEDSLRIAITIDGQLPLTWCRLGILNERRQIKTCIDATKLASLIQQGPNSSQFELPTVTNLHKRLFSFY
jgi:hypothetical protein